MLKHRIQPGQLEQVARIFGGAGDAEGAADASCARMGTHQRANARAVDRGDGVEIGDQVAVALAEQPLDRGFEFLGRPSCNEGLARSEHQVTTRQLAPRTAIRLRWHQIVATLAQRQRN